MWDKDKLTIHLPNNTPTFELAKANAVNISNVRLRLLYQRLLFNLSVQTHPLLIYLLIFSKLYFLFCAEIVHKGMG